MKLNAILLLAALPLSSMFAATSAPSGNAKDQQPTQSQKEPKPYPLTTCIVTDNDLGSMGEETSMVHEGQVVKFCCAPCERKFLKNPAKYLAKLEPKAEKKSP